MSTNEPNAKQLQALRDYADYYGPEWKKDLNVDWYRAGSEWSGPYQLLHQLRNQLGPKWLMTFEFPEVD